MERNYWTEFAERRLRARQGTRAASHEYRSPYVWARRRARGVGRPGRETAYGIR
jgi:hypothetical protein